ncbi:MAG TPA: enoyl-CoA hydratase-related protein [Cyclobacteriaceae bacterium]|nr:enoyl-CoA hydratase-related protein [Cyclobacteriaceae bacterium]
MPLLKTLEENGLLTVIISRPDALNALNAETLDGLGELVQEVYQNAKIRGTIFIGEGSKSFVAGADIRELSILSREKAFELSSKGQDLFRRIEHCPKPILAALNGFALGGGCELAMACHVRIAVESARLGQPEINLGIIPGYGGTQRLTQLVGRGKALELLLTGDMITAREALSLGLINHVVADHNELLSFSKNLMNKIISKSPVAIANIIKSVNAGFGFEKAGYEAEATNFAACTTTEDFKEGTSAFLEKRKAVFKGK